MSGLLSSCVFVDTPNQTWSRDSCLSFHKSRVILCFRCRDGLCICAREATLPKHLNDYVTVLKTARLLQKKKMHSDLMTGKLLKKPSRKGNRVCSRLNLARKKKNLHGSSFNSRLTFFLDFKGNIVMVGSRAGRRKQQTACQTQKPQWWRSRPADGCAGVPTVNRSPAVSAESINRVE